MAFSAPLHRMTQTVVFQVNTPAKDAGGNVTASWANSLTDVPADIQFKSSDEVLRSGRDNTRKYATVYCRTADVSGLTEAHRMTWSSRTFEIESLRDVDEQGRLTIIDVEETKP